MSDPTGTGAEVVDALRRYFAATTSADLPRAVRQMSARTLTARRRHQRTLLASAAAGLAGVAAVVALAANLGSHGLSASSSRGSGSAPLFAPAAGNSATGTALAYPGVDVERLGQSGLRLLAPGGHGTAIIGAAQAQADAVAAAGAGAGAPGPAVLAFVTESGRPQPASCLCWVVAVHVAGGAQGNQSATASTFGELVFVDADSSRIFTKLQGAGTP